MYEFGAREVDAATRVLQSRQLFRYLPDAHEAETMESSLADLLEVKHALATSSGTAALICGLAAVGVGPGDEVLVPAYGYVACAVAPLALGALPVVVDIDESLTMDPADLTRRVSGRSRVVLPVHVNGNPADMDALMAVATEHSLAVVEDACQAIGGTYRGRRLGTFGDVGVFSFNQHKIITAGEGGALVTNDTEVYERAFMMHDGSCLFSPHDFRQPVHAGLAFRMSEITAAIVAAQMTRLPGILNRLRTTRSAVAAALANIPGATPVPIHDEEGSCATTLGYIFSHESTADTFLKAVDDDDFRAFRGNVYGHSFDEWSLLHDGRGAHHPARNPLEDPAVRQQEGSCPRSTDLLRRTVLVAYRLDPSPSALDALRLRVEQAMA